jgi:hypothetical protein
LYNSFVDVSKSNAELVQQGRFLGHNTCIFANELAYLVLELIDSFGNSIPMTDTEAYVGHLDFYFQFGSEFSDQECK